MSIPCETAKDLIPLCVDGTASKESAKSVKEHISHCADCKKFYAECKKNIHSNNDFISDFYCDDASDCVIEAANGYVALSKRLKRRHIIKTVSVCALAVVALFCIVKDIYSIINSKQSDRFSRLCDRFIYPR